MRVFPAELGKPMIGEQLSRVIKTRNGQFPLETLVLSKAGWTSHYISNGQDLSPISFDIGSTSLSHTLGALGMPGATAFIGLEQISPKPNEILLITAAAGAVGSIAGQLAKLKGLKVIGLVGSDDKLDWCKNELGFDHVFNYKKCNWSEEVAKVAPDGIDIYWDHVGGETVINKHLRKFGRLLKVDNIAVTNDINKKPLPDTSVAIAKKELTVKGFFVYNFHSQFPYAFTQLNKFIQENTLKTKEKKFLDHTDTPLIFYEGLNACIY